MARLPRDVQNAINRQSPRHLHKKLEARAQLEFEKIKDEMIDAFNSHEVTIEIEEGPSADNSSGTLGGHGNLFSFIGFTAGEKPTSTIRDRLLETKLKIQSKRGQVLNMETTEPTRQEIFELTPLPWAGGRSWADGIETGISGLGKYLYDEGKTFSKSHSGTALQLGGGKKSGKAFGGGDTGGATGPQRSRFSRTSYISSILKTFKKRIISLRNRTLRT